MKARLFAAGLGTRLRPLTAHRPKALVEVAGKSLLERNLDKLLREGCSQVVVNIHYFGEQIIDFVEAMPRYESKVIISDERSAILETGGGLLLAKHHFTDADFLVHNVDILSDLPLQNGLMQAQLSNRALATLATRQRKTSRYLLFGEEDNLLCGWENVVTGERRIVRPRKPATLVRRAFSGVSAYHPRIFNYMPDRAGSAFSIIETLLTAAATEAIYCYPHDGGRWIDVGRPDAVSAAAKLFPEE